MIDVKSVEAGKYNLLLADALKKEEEIKAPDWCDYVKSSSNRERPIFDEDFWYKRTASILRQIYLRGIVGVSRMRTRYGGKKDRGQKPSKFVKSGGKIIRLILQQTEKAGFVEKANGKVKGRQLTAKGKEFLENIAKEAK